jgi:two-component system phosphate regulon sensor histidine kinase PhoR
MKTSFTKNIFLFLIIIVVASFLTLAFHLLPELDYFFLIIGILALILAITTVLSYLRAVHLAWSELTDFSKKFSQGDFPQTASLKTFEDIGGDSISLRKMNEAVSKRLAELSAEKDKLKAILEGMIEGVLVTDANGKILLANPSLYRMLPLEGRAEGKTLLECIRNKDIHETLERALETHSPQENEVTLQVDTEEKNLMVYATPIVESKELTGAIYVFFDVTNIRKLENSRKEFVANVSHELKTPLTNIRGYAETLRTGALKDPEVAERFVQKIENNSVQLHNLIEDLLRLAEIESGRVEKNPIAVSLPTTVAELKNEFADLIQKKNLSFEINVPHNLIVRAEPSALKQILSNLLNNAIKYTSEGGKIFVSAETNNDFCKVMVTDTGIGIPETDLPHVFERFYRVDKARSREVGGTGLGLAIVKHLVQTQGGEVGVSSQYGKGSQFYFTLPLSPK